MKIAITAASGQLGGAIARATATLIGSENVIAIARTPEKAAHLGLEVRQADYNSQADFEAALQGVDAVLLVSGYDAPEKRIEQHRNVIRAAKAAGVKKMVYTSIQGVESDTTFSPIVQSNRQTEKDIRESGLEWAIGRNGIYIEPDVEYIEQYKLDGKVSNCAGEGKCGYTTRDELAYAYARMLTESQHNGFTYRLHGTPITQQQLTDYLNGTFGISLEFESVDVAAYEAERVEALGPHLGKIIAGIYAGIATGKLDVPSDFEQAAGRPHISWGEYFGNL